MRLGPKNEAADADHASRLQRHEQQDVWLLAAHSADRRDVIALLVEDGIDLGEIHELLELDRPASLGRERDELIFRDGHELAVIELDPSHHVIGVDSSRRGH